MRQRVARFTPVLLAFGCGAMSLTASPGVGRAQSSEEQVVPVPQDDEYADTDPSALTDFRPTLDPHGSWIDDSTYGTAWTPNQDEVGPDFVPYDSDGQWDYVDGDYSWVSDFVWGWVCFHYGRWVFSSGFWLWIPGRTYAPAWVDWRLTNDDPTYLGWAPTPPAWGWSGGSAVRLVLNTYAPWTYVGASDVFGPGLSTRLITGVAAQRLTMHSHPYVRTHTQAPGRQMLPPVMHGPPPGLLGIDARIAHPAYGAREQKARQFARPSTALPLGAHAPATHVLRASPIRQTWGPGSPSRGGGARGRR